tara:strand:- start:2406 stop:2873 length:468 start_codon:yes stop_codon:yes gene_type:complete
MASTLKVTLTENLTVDGNDYSSTRTKSFTTITNVYKTTVAVGTGGGTILNLAGSAGDIGTLDEDTIEYMRITNLDTANYVELGFEKESSTASGYWVKVDAGRSFIVPVSNTTTEHPDFAAHDSDHVVPSYGEIESITAKANTAACNIEIMVAMNG